MNTKWQNPKTLTAPNFTNCCDNVLNVDYFPKNEDVYPTIHDQHSANQTSSLVIDSFNRISADSHNLSMQNDSEQA